MTHLSKVHVQLLHTTHVMYLWLGFIAIALCYCIFIHIYIFPILSQTCLPSGSDAPSTGESISWQTRTPRTSWKRWISRPGWAYGRARTTWAGGSRRTFWASRSQRWVLLEHHERELVVRHILHLSVHNSCHSFSLQLGNTLKSGII